MSTGIKFRGVQMRGAFNGTADYYYGPSSPFGPPGVQYAAAVPCRLVLQTEIDQGDFPLRLAHAWMTADAALPHTPDYKSFALGDWYAQIATADQVAIPTGTPPAYYAIRLEDVVPFSGSPYSRVMLIPISAVTVANWLPPSPPPPPPPPPPPAPPVPGSSCGAATALVDGEVTLFTIPGFGGGWVTFDYSASGECFYSTCGVRGSVVYELWLGPDCSALADQGEFNEDSYIPIFDVVGNKLFMQFSSTQLADQVVAICASQTIL
jgi:hypothetical protein